MATVNRATAAQERLVQRLTETGWSPITATADPAIFQGPQGIITVPRRSVCAARHETAAMVLLSTTIERLATLWGVPAAALREEVLCG